MKDITSTYRNFATIFFSGRDEPYTFELRHDDVERLEYNMSQFANSTAADWFFCCDTVDGKTMSINLSTIQAIHCKWEPTSSPEDTKRHEGPVKVIFKNRPSPMVIDPGNPEEFIDFFFIIESEPSGRSFFHKVTNEDGDNFLINTGELQLIEVPTHFLQKNNEINSEEDID